MIKTFYNIERPLYSPIDDDNVVSSPNIEEVSNENIEEDLNILGDNVSSKAVDVILGVCANLANDNIGCNGDSCVSHVSCGVVGTHQPIQTGNTILCPDYCATNCPSDCSSDCPIDNLCFPLICGHFEPPTFTGDTTVRGIYYYYPIRLYGLPSIYNKLNIPYKISSFINNSSKEGYYNGYIHTSGSTNTNFKNGFNGELIHVEDNKYVIINYYSITSEITTPQTFTIFSPGHMPKSGVTVYPCEIIITHNGTITNDVIKNNVLSKLQTSSASTDVFMDTLKITISGATADVPSGICYSGTKIKCYERYNYFNSGYTEENEYYYGKPPHNQLHRYLYRQSNANKYYNTQSLSIYTPYRWLVLQPTRAGFNFSNSVVDTWYNVPYGTNQLIDVLSSGYAFTNKNINWYGTFSAITATPTNELLTRYEHSKIFDSATRYSGFTDVRNLPGETILTPSNSLLEYSQNKFSYFHLSSALTSYNECINASNLTVFSGLTQLFYCVNNLTATTIDAPKSSIYCVFDYKLGAEASTPKTDIGPFSNLGQNIWYANYEQLSGKVTCEKWVDNKIHAYFMNMSQIRDWAFSEYPNLKKCYISSDIQTIGDGAFYADSNCDAYIFIGYTTVPTLSNIRAFTSMKSTCKIVVPNSLLSAWKGATNWSALASYIVSDSTYNDI